MKQKLRSQRTAKLRQILQVTGMAAICLALCSASKPALAGPPIGINIDNVADWNGEILFADAFKESRDWRLADGTTPAPVDSNGWPTSDANLYVWAGAPNDMSGTYALSFNGQATIASGGTISNQVYNSGTNTTTATLVMTNTDNNMAFTNTKRTSGSATNTGITNVKLMRPLTPGSTSTYATNVTFSAQPKNLVAKFGTIRFMDFLSTNGNAQTNWSDRILPTNNSQVVIRTGYGWPGVGGSWEYAIQLCNETNKDMWINIPEPATDAYVTNVAKMIAYGSDGTNPYNSTQGSPVYAPLNSGLKVYVEFSNEVWNTGGAFTQSLMNHTSAVNEVNAGGSPLNFDGGTGDWDWAAHRAAKRTVEISNIFRTVFGDAAMMSRVRPVLESQEAYTSFWLMDEAHMLEDYYNNSARVATPHPPSYYIYGGGGAAYYGPDNNSDTLTISNIWTSSSFVANVFATSAQSDADYALALYGKRIAYEGGPSMDNVGHSEAVKAQAWGDARMTGIITGNQTAWNQTGGDLLMYFNSVGSDYQFCFTQNVNNLNTPKLNGVDQINTSTQATGNYGIVVPCTIPSGNYLAPPTWAGANPSNMAANANWTWTTYTVNTSSAVALTVSLSAGSAGAGNQGDVYVDGVLAGTIAIPNTGSNGTFATSPTVTSAVLPAGTHGILIKAKAGSFGFNSVIVTSGGGGGIPPVPTGFTATAGNAQVALSWNASSGATAYDVKRSTVSGSGYVTVNSPATTSYTNTGLTNGTTYYFVVDAKNASGTSANSSQASATPSAGGGGGSLTGSSTTSTAGVSLTTEGTADWIHFGNGSVPGIDRMSSGGSQISAYTIVGAGGPNTYTNDPRPLSWTNGAPTASSTNNLTGVYISGVGNGFSITAPADTTQRTLIVHVGGWSSTGALTAHLSDGSAVDFNNTAAGNLSAQYDVNYTLVYTAASAAKTLTVTWKMATGTGNVTINGAALVTGGGSPPPAPTGLTATPGNAQVALTWNASTGATAYDVKRSTTSGSGYVTVSSPTTTSYTNTGLTNGTTYYFVVDAKNASGASANSSQVSATPSGGTPVNLSTSFNLTGIYNDGVTFSGGIDGSGFALSGTLLGTSQTWSSTPFTIGAGGALDVVSGGGQTITLPAGAFTSLKMLATAVGGNQPSQGFTVTYTDNSTSAFTQSLSDWFSPQSYAGETNAIPMSYRNQSNGTKDNRTFYVYGYSFTLNGAKTVKNVILPNNGGVKILALTLK